MKYDNYKFFNDIDSNWIWAKGWVEGSFPDKIGIDTLDECYQIWINRTRTPYKRKYAKKYETRITFVFQFKEDGIEFIKIIGDCPYDAESMNLACQIMKELAFEYEKYRID